MAALRWQQSAAQPARIMGVLNCTPDSFSDGGLHLDAAAAIAHGRAMFEAGAAIIDVGGESTRPGAAPVSTEEELTRVLPVIEALAGEDIPVSIDTMKAAVMRRAVAAGAVMVNDVTALTGDADSLAAVAEGGSDVCLMHMQGTPETMQEHPHYDDVFDEVCAFFEARIAASLSAGIRESAIWLDPGIGFGKRHEDNLTLIARLDELKRRFGRPVLLGISRKSFLGRMTGSPVEDREIETAAATAIGTFLGADLHRVHDVPAQLRAMRVASAIAAGGR
jgi:dihydropteroate synthase